LQQFHQTASEMNYYERPIREWVAEDRPREKLLEKGISALTEAELLATLLASGTQKLSAIGLARLLLDEFGGLRNLSRASMTELMSVHGVGQAKASCIVAAFELARRKLSTEHQLVNFTYSGDIARYLIPKIGDLRSEVFYVISLDRKHSVIGESEIHKGGVSSVYVDPKIVFKEAINRLASSIVLCHNHPSGSVLPSKADDKITQHLVAAGRMLEIPILDHIIVARQNWYSYGDHGRIREMEALAALVHTDPKAKSEEDED
jgi:DNA repair protein RadC